jgi:hypothetical protein
LKKCHPEVIEKNNADRAAEAVAKGESIKSFLSYGGSFFQAFLKWVVYTFQPISTCENEHFRAMCYELNPKVQYFDRHKVTDVIGQQAARVKATLKTELQNKYYSLTCDHWISLAGTNYLGVTAHYITEGWKLRSFTLSCNEHIGSSKADDILRELRLAWESYDLDTSHLMGVVTDTAPVMGAFGRQLPAGVPHFYCVDHVLELTTISIIMCWPPLSLSLSHTGTSLSYSL